MIAYRLTENAKVKLRVQRKRGKRFATVGKLKDKGKPGKNRKRFSGVVPRGRGLSPSGLAATALPIRPRAARCPPG